MVNFIFHCIDAIWETVIMTRDIVGTALFLLLIIFGCGFITFIIHEAHVNMVESKARLKACYNAGGIPIDQYGNIYCVKPGSFIEVK
jgi:hypothetical protein